MREYILASGSPRRIEMMKANGIKPLIIPALIEENLPLHSGMTETVSFLALKKAKAVEAQYLAQPHIATSATDLTAKKPPIIIAADTIVYKDKIMGKPKDKEEGMNMLWSLRDDCHYVVTGVALLEAGRPHGKVFYEITKVFFKDYSRDALSQYLDTPEAYDKAGGYAIQGYFAKYIDHIEGDYNNVVGFPWDRIQKELNFFEKQ